jgi:hypothetical protein
MTWYRVEWNINVEAENPEDAVRQALEIQRDPESIATVFEVIECDEDGHPVQGSPREIDLLEDK